MIIVQKNETIVAIIAKRERFTRRNAPFFFCTISMILFFLLYNSLAISKVRLPVIFSMLSIQTCHDGSTDVMPHAEYGTGNRGGGIGGEMESSETGSKT